MLILGCPNNDDQRQLEVVTQTGTAQALLPILGEIISRYAYYEMTAPDFSDMEALNFDQNTSKLLQSLFKRMEPRRRLWRVRCSLINRARICPLCRISEAFHLDHFLPKESFPEFSIFSRNLIPACAKCNTLKGTDATGQFIHCYYDNLPRRHFLVAEVDIEPGVVSVRFSVNVTAIANPLQSKIIHHFQKLKLAERYSMQAAERIETYAPALQRSFENSGTRGVIADLKSLYKAALGRGPNHWEVVLLRSLLRTPAYVNGAFRGL